MSSAHCRCRVLSVCVLCVLASGLRAPAQPSGAASQPAANRMASRTSPLAATIGNARLILTDLKKSFEKGEAPQAGDDSSRPDSRMAILSMLIRDKIPHAASRRIADDAAREAILEEMKAAADYIDREIMPAYDKAVRSKDPADAKALVPLLDGLSPRLTQADQTAIRYAEQAPPVRPATPAAPTITSSPADASAPTIVPAPADEWTRYVQRFILMYRLDDAQQAQAWQILKELQGRADEYRISHRTDYEAANQIDDRTARAEKLRALDQPLDEMFEELKARLEPLPTEAQRKAASAGKPTRPSSASQPGVR